MSPKSSPYKVAVEDCPHTNLGPWEPWAMLGLTIATCKDCGNTLAQEPDTDPQEPEAMCEGCDRLFEANGETYCDDCLCKQADEDL